MKKCILMLFFLVASACTSAEDGIEVKFAIEKRSTINNDVSIYTTAVSQKFDESKKYKFEGKYEIKLFTRSINEKENNLTVTIKDLSGDKPFYLGAKSFDLEIGSSKPIRLAVKGHIYSIDVGTSYGKISE